MHTSETRAHAQPLQQVYTVKSVSSLVFRSATVVRISVIIERQWL